ncbi:MAG: DUF6036 family nucleotidyltransferase [Gemmatimonadota bacterium]
MGAILHTDEILVIGSQAIHGANPEGLPPEAERSIEVDVAAFGDTTGVLADLIDGAIGEASMFHATFGYYAQGVVETTAVLPDGWRDRLLPFTTPATMGATAWCLEPHDLWISKAIANRPRDLEFCTALVRCGLVDIDLLVERLAAVPNLSDEHREMVAARIAKAATQS